MQKQSTSQPKSYKFISWKQRWLYKLHQLLSENWIQLPNAVVISNWKNIYRDSIEITINNELLKPRNYLLTYKTIIKLEYEIIEF